MLAFTIFLGVACVVLLVILSAQDNKNTKLAVENSMIKGRMEALQEKTLTTVPREEENLTADGIMEAIRFAGYVPERNANWVRFLTQGEEFFIDVERLPMLLVMRLYDVATQEMEMDLLKQAAHLMSDELIMVKALIYEREDCGTSLRFYVVSFDRDYYNFRSNLPRYISMIIDGNRRMNEIYNQLV